MVSTIVLSNSLIETLKMDEKKSAKLIKILPKPIKTVQRPILVQGPNNKILSLQIKSPVTSQLQNRTNKSYSGDSATTNLLKTSRNSAGSISECYATLENPNSQYIPQQKINQKFISTNTSTTNQSSLLRTTPTTSPNTSMTVKQILSMSEDSLKETKGVPTPNFQTREVLNIQKSVKMSENLGIVNLPNNITLSKTSKTNKPPEPSPFVTIEKKKISKTAPIIINSLLEAGFKTTEIQARQQQKKIELLQQHQEENKKKCSDEIIEILEEEQQQDNEEKRQINISPVTTNYVKSEKKNFVSEISKDNQAPLDEKHILILLKPKLKQIKNIKSLREQFKQKTNLTYLNKEKQRSLLKTRKIESLLQSPRTKERSKSLNLQNIVENKNLKKRRQSTASDSIQIEHISLDKDLLSVNNKMNNSDEYLIKSSAIQQSGLNPSAVKSDKFISNDFFEVKKKKHNPTSGEVINILKWRNGIGTTKDRHLAFHLNEFGLVEILEKTVLRNHDDICYEKPIFEREIRSKNTSDYVDPLYFCKGCNCHGPAVEFLAPHYCSQECIARYDKKRLNKTDKNKIDAKIQNYKKKTLHRKKRFIENNNKTENWDFPVGGVIDNQLQVIPKRIFSWTNYLSSSKAEPATIDLFLNPFPCGPNLFEVGMKLEAIDPEHSMFCVCSIAEKKGYRLKLHFDGFPKLYDFWINADSMDIFPPGWCARTNRVLQPPKNINSKAFTWASYFIKTKSKPAPRHLFTHLNSTSTTNPFKIGMKFEADDLRNTRKVCVATVADILDNRILVHFDGWDECYDYWVDCCSPYIHPVNWHRQNQFEIVPPPEWRGQFNWQIYFDQNNGTPATGDLFQTREAIQFKPGMKLEIVDKKNSSLIRPATVLMTDEYEIKVIFDGWPKEYVFWVADDNPDIHPIGWCEATCHELESPPGFEGLPAIMPCPMTGCRGIGNANRPDLEYHSTIDCCPYELSNWSMELEKPERLESADIKFGDEINTKSQKKLFEIVDFTNQINISIKESHDKIKDIPTKQEILTTSPTPVLNLPLILSKTEKTLLKDTQLKIYKELLCDYGPRLEQNYDLWIKNSSQIKNYHKEKSIKNPLKWDVNEVVEYISHLPYCLTAAEIFRREDIDGEAFLSLRQQDLTEILHMKLGQTIKIYNQVLHLRAEVLSHFKNEFF